MHLEKERTFRASHTANRWKLCKYTFTVHKFFIIPDIKKKKKRKISDRINNGNCVHSQQISHFDDDNNNNNTANSINSTSSAIRGSATRIERSTMMLVVGPNNLFASRLHYTVQLYTRDIVSLAWCIVKPASVLNFPLHKIVYNVMKYPKSPWTCSGCCWNICHKFSGQHAGEENTNGDFWPAFG